MTAFQIMLLCAVLIYWIYTVVVVRMFGIPSSYSETFYKLNEIKKGLGVLFPIMLISMTGLLMPSWLELSDKLLPNLTFFAFFGGAGLVFVAVAPYFKECERDTGHPILDLIYRSFHGQGLVHTIGALLSMISVIIWTSFSSFWWIMLISLLVITILALSTKSLKSAIIFWVEFLIFNTILAIMSYGTFVVL